MNSKLGRARQDQSALFDPSTLPKKAYQELTINYKSPIVNRIKIIDLHNFKVSLV